MVDGPRAEDVLSLLQEGLATVTGDRYSSSPSLRAGNAFMPRISNAFICHYLLNIPW
jgi:hypothetical protein